MDDTASAQAMRLTVWFAVVAAVNSQRNLQVTFDDCRSDSEPSIVLVSGGALVTSQSHTHYTQPALNCSRGFTSSTGTLAVRLDLLDTRQTNSGDCVDYVTVSNSTITHTYCGSDTLMSDMVYTGTVDIRWVTGDKPDSRHQGFTIILTAVAGSCGRPVQCNNNACVERALMCDGVKHCWDGTDELTAACLDVPDPDKWPNMTRPVSTTTHKPPSPPTTLLALPTPSPTASGPTPWTFDGLDIVSTGIVLVIFAAVFVICLVLGVRERRRRRENRHASHESPVDTENTLLNNLNATGGEGGTNAARPATPPPSYSIIERQISYVSDISQNSDMIMVPPGYEEALMLPGTMTRGSRIASAGGSNPRRLHHTNSLLRHNNRARMFSRSMSDSNGAARADSTSNNGGTSDVPQPGHTSRLSSNGHASRLSSNQSDSVFLDPPPPATESDDVILEDSEAEAAAGIPSPTSDSGRAQTAEHGDNDAALQGLRL